MKMIGFIMLFIFPVLSKAQTNLDSIKLPKGFQIELLAKVPYARGMSISPSGTIYVGSRSEEKIFAVIRENLKTKEVVTLVSDQDEPIGVAFHKGDLYFSTIGKIQKLPNIEASLKKPPKPVLVTDKIENDRRHGWKYIAIGPDEKLYVPIGAPCNVCKETDTHALLLRMDLNGKNKEVVARGIRNTVGFDWHPDTKELWFTDNGRDWLGDDSPSCELNHMSKVGLHFGFPYCHAGDVLDPDFGVGKKCANYIAPAQKLGPHVAPLGMRFYTGKMFPEKYKNQIFIAEHGSWNRSKRIGYRVMLVRLENNKAVSYEPFAEGWLKNEDVSGRPVDIAIDLDGSLLVSDDFAGAIYRISYKK
ncbi:MAG: PQQ-dependent sugar dehydrogenase [Oligoflexia bacterium]|nr:PQQ-dependent sugar dehydrogenase [Oligoflexia bacterium]